MILKKTKLLETIVHSDFNIIPQKTIVKTSIVVDQRLKVGLQKNFDTVNLLILNKTLKQFIRILQFLKRKRKKSMTIYVANQQIAEIFQKLILQSPFQILIKVQTNLRSIKIKKRRDKKLILLIDNNFLTSSCIKNFLEHHMYLINKINIKTEKNSEGIYKIFNNLNELSKIVFIFSILHKILGKNDKSK